VAVRALVPVVPPVWVVSPVLAVLPVVVVLPVPVAPPVLTGSVTTMDCAALDKLVVWSVAVTVSVAVGWP
jgi:hypothetical protein